MKKNLKPIMLITLSIILFVFSFMLFKKSMNNYSQDVINYDVNSVIDYKVYLKENNYFDKPYLEKDKVYITSLIDYIDIDFSYDMDLDSKRNGKYIYSITGIMSANVSNTDKDYWQKTYKLLDSKEVNYEDLDKINFLENIKIDYQFYNNLLIQFKEEFKLAIDGVFKVILNVENYVQSNTEYELKNQTTTSLEIPLTKATIEVPIEINEVKKTDQLVGDLIYSERFIYKVFKGLSILLLINGLILLGYGVYLIVKNIEKISNYNKELKRILKTYDGIIVNVSFLPNYDNLNLIDVSSFTELLDAHGEIRQPISCYKTKKQATFILINGNIVWRYVLKDNEYEK